MIDIFDKKKHMKPTPLVFQKNKFEQRHFMKTCYTAVSTIKTNVFKWFKFELLIPHAHVISLDFTKKKCILTLRKFKV